MILEFAGKKPKVDPTAFVAENAMVMGDCECNDSKIADQGFYFLSLTKKNQFFINRMNKESFTIAKGNQS